ncbi:MAG: hypothetical protein ABW047_16775 [Nitrospiraceae bacterium]|jgi:hypothetical protein
MCFGSVSGVSINADHANRGKLNCGLAAAILGEAALDQPCAKATSHRWRGRWPISFLPAQLELGQRATAVHKPSKIDLAGSIRHGAILTRGAVRNRV